MGAVYITQRAETYINLVLNADGPLTLAFDLGLLVGWDLTPNLVKQLGDKFPKIKPLIDGGQQALTVVRVINNPFKTISGIVACCVSHNIGRDLILDFLKQNSLINGQLDGYAKKHDDFNRDAFFDSMGLLIDSLAIKAGESAGTWMTSVTAEKVVAKEGPVITKCYSETHRAPTEVGRKLNGKLGPDDIIITEFGPGPENPEILPTLDSNHIKQFQKNYGITLDPETLVLTSNPNAQTLDLQGAIFESDDRATKILTTAYHSRGVWSAKDCKRYEAYCLPADKIKVKRDGYPFDIINRFQTEFSGKTVHVIAGALHGVDNPAADKYCATTFIGKEAQADLTLIQQQSSGFSSLYEMFCK